VLLGEIVLSFCNLGFRCGFPTQFLMVKTNVMLIIDSQHFGMMYEHLKVAKRMCLTFGIMFSPKLGNSGPSSPSFKKSPQIAIIGGSNLESATMEKECGMWQQTKCRMGALNGLRQSKSPDPKFTTTPTTSSPSFKLGV
jgi:hypothetical protein